MKSYTTTMLIALIFMLGTKATLDIAQAPLAMELTADLESRILKDAQRELTESKTSL